MCKEITKSPYKLENKSYNNLGSKQNGCQNKKNWEWKITRI